MRVAHAKLPSVSPACCSFLTFSLFAWPAKHGNAAACCNSHLAISLLKVVEEEEQGTCRSQRCAPHFDTGGWSAAAAACRTGPRRAATLLKGDWGACAVQGPVLRSIQRYGRLGRRSGNVPEESLESRDKIKEAKYIYLSIDEAGTHVGVRCFRCARAPAQLPAPQPAVHACAVLLLLSACTP